MNPPTSRRALLAASLATPAAFALGKLGGNIVHAADAEDVNLDPRAHDEAFTPTVLSGPHEFYPWAPYRLFDTRPGQETGWPIGFGKFQAGQRFFPQINGGWRALVVCLIVVEPDGAGYAVAKAVNGAFTSDLNWGLQTMAPVSVVTTAPISAANPGLFEVTASVNCHLILDVKGGFK